MQPFPEVRRALYDHEGKLKPFSDLYFESNLGLIFSALVREIFQFRLTTPKQLVKLFETREVFERFIDILEFQPGHLERESAWHYAFVLLAGTRTGYAKAIRKAALGDTATVATRSRTSSKISQPRTPYVESRS